MTIVIPPVRRTPRLGETRRAARASGGGLEETAPGPIARAAPHPATTGHETAAAGAGPGETAGAGPHNAATTTAATDVAVGGPMVMLAAVMVDGRIETATIGAPTPTVDNARVDAPAVLLAIEKSGAMAGRRVASVVLIAVGEKAAVSPDVISDRDGSTVTSGGPTVGAATHPVTEEETPGVSRTGREVTSGGARREAERGTGVATATAVPAAEAPAATAVTVTGGRIARDAPSAEAAPGADPTEAVIRASPEGDSVTVTGRTRAGTSVRAANGRPPSRRSTRTSPARRSRVSHVVTCAPSARTTHWAWRSTW